MKTAAPDRKLKAILEIGKLITGRHDLDRVLGGIVSKAAGVMGTNAASLYLLDEARNEISLRATKGLSARAVGRVRMKVGEGLTGMAVERMRPVSVADASRHPQYKFFPETHEEKFRSFLGVPLIDKHRPVGALVVQTRAVREFTPDEVNLLSAIATQIVGVVENARLQDHIEGMKRVSEAVPTPKAAAAQPGLLQGVGGSSGIGIGRAAIVRRRTKTHAAGVHRVNPKVEKRRMLRALRSAEKETAETVRRAAQQFSREEIAIFDAYELILKDPHFRSRIIDLIDRGYSAREALQQITNEFKKTLSQAESIYLRERAFDVVDVGHRILEYLDGESREIERPRSYKGPEILVAENLGIYDLVEIDRKRTQGIVTASGGAYSHVAILARSMQLPLVLGVEGLTERVKRGDQVIVDSTAGLVHVNPPPSVEAEYRKSRSAVKAHWRRAIGESHLPAQTADGASISVGANVGMLSNVREAMAVGIDEIGLYRTEFPFLIRSTTPTEEEQYNLYRKVTELAEGKPVTLRTLDVGGDKTLSYIGFPSQENPILGWRSIRVSLEREDLFKIQLRAVYRAARHGQLSLLFPMITCVEEVRKVKEVLADVVTELAEEMVPFRQNIPIGAMIEVPAAVHIIERLAREVDFFSIGTNDLVQYTLAVDRNNQKVSPLYDPLHPAVLDMIHRVVQAAGKAQRPVTVCGEMAGNPVYAAALLAIGVRKLSMGAEAIPRVKQFIRGVRLDRLEGLGPEILACDTGADVRKALAEIVRPTA
jgi:phosphotransferase system enzyme I (PtsP)